MLLILSNCRTSPVVVHCSAGVGRTGTVIGLDTIANAIDANEPTLDIYGVVYNMRKDRCLMVRKFKILYFMFCILTSEQVLHMQLASQSHLFGHFNIFHCHKQKKSKDSTKSKEKQETVFLDHSS